MQSARYTERMLPGRISAAASLALLPLCTAPVCATDYVVELVLFEPAAEETEFEALEEVIEDEIRVFDSSTFGASGAQPLSAFPRLSRDNMRLQTAWERLINSRLYQPLMHVGWTQEGLRGKEAFAVDLGGRTRGTITLGGTARLERERYLHLTLDLQLRDGARVFRINERRRMRSREMHYFDHPRFGVIATVRPADEVESSE